MPYGPCVARRKGSDTAANTGNDRNTRKRKRDRSVWANTAVCTPHPLTPCLPTDYERPQQQFQVEAVEGSWVVFAPFLPCLAWSLAMRSKWLSEGGGSGSGDGKAKGD